MANWTKIASRSDVPDGGCRVVEAAGCTLALFNVAGAYHAIDNTCVHQGGPLGEGTLDGAIVTCPWHHWSYDVRTGRTTMSEAVGVKRYPVEVRGEEIFADLE